MAQDDVREDLGGARGARARAGGRRVADLRRPPPRPRGHLCPGVRGAAARRPQGPPARPHARDRRPQRSHRPARAHRARRDRATTSRASRSRRWSTTARSSASRSTACAAARQGIVHVIGPELGLSSPASRSPAATRTPPRTARSARWRCRSAPPRSSTCWRRSACRRSSRKTMRITYEGEPGFGVTAKDLILGTIGQISAAGAIGHAVEYAGRADRGAVGRGPHDDLQHVDRGRRARRHDRTGRHHLRVRGGTAGRAGGLRRRRSSAGARCRPTPARRSTPRSRSTPRRSARR